MAAEKLIDLVGLDAYYRAVDVPQTKAITNLHQQMLEVQAKKQDAVEGLEGQVLGFVKDNEVGVVQVKTDAVDATQVREIVNDMVDQGILTKDSVTVSTFRASTFGIEVQNIAVGTSEFPLDDFVDLKTRFANMNIYDVAISLYAWNSSEGLPITVVAQYPINKLLLCNHGTKTQGRAVFKVTVFYREQESSTP